jgi:acetyl esterase/lipase
MASPQFDKILPLIQQRQQQLIGATSVEDVRDGLEAIAAKLIPPEGVQTEAVDSDGVRCEWVSAPGANPEHVICYFHGGSYLAGSLNTHRNHVANLSAVSGARALNVDYRLSPEHPFPAAVDDARIAYQWLLAQGISATNIVIAGDSAGGGLALGALLALRDAGVDLPCAGVCMSPWTDMTKSGESFVTKVADDPYLSPDGLPAAEWYVGDEDPRHPYASPVFGDFTGLPPLYIVVGGREILLSDSIRVAEKADADGVEVILEIWYQMFHIFPFFAHVLPEAKQASEKIGMFMRERLARQ